MVEGGTLFLSIVFLSLCFWCLTLDYCVFEFISNAFFSLSILDVQHFLLFVSLFRFLFAVFLTFSINCFLLSFCSWYPRLRYFLNVFSFSRLLSNLTLSMVFLSLSLLYVQQFNAISRMFVFYLFYSSLCLSFIFVHWPDSIYS